MKNILKKFMILSLGLAVLATGCKKDEEESIPSLNGTYQGTIIVILTDMIPDMIEQEIEATFTVTDESKLSTMLQIPVGEQTLPLPLSMELIDKQTFKNVTLTTEDGESVIITGTGFKIKSLTIPISGVGTFTLAGSPIPVAINGAYYHGFQGEVKGGGTGIVAMLTGTVSSAPGELLYGQIGNTSLPVTILLEGTKQ